MTLERAYRGHKVKLTRVVRGGLPRWIASVQLQTPYGEICLAAIVGENVLVNTHEAMMRLGKRIATAADGEAETSGLDGTTWAELCALYDEVGADQSFRGVAQQIDQVVRDPAIQELASWIPFVNVAAKAATVASRIAVEAAQPPQPPQPGEPGRSGPPLRSRRPVQMPMLPPRVARTAALVGRVKAGDPSARQALREIRRQAEEGNRMARAVTMLAARLDEAGVPALTGPAARIVEYAAPVNAAVIIDEEAEPGPSDLDVLAGVDPPWESLTQQQQQKKWEEVHKKQDEAQSDRWTAEGRKLNPKGAAELDRQLAREREEYGLPPLSAERRRAQGQVIGDDPDRNPCWRDWLAPPENRGAA